MNKKSLSLFKYFKGSCDTSFAFTSGTTLLSALLQIDLATWRWDEQWPPEGKMKFFKGGNSSVYLSIHFSKSVVKVGLNSVFFKWASLAEECGVATHDPMSWRTHWTCSSWLTRTWSLQNSAATPIAEVSSSVDPKASNMMSSLDLRSPVYVEEVPLSPVFV